MIVIMMMMMMIMMMMINVEIKMIMIYRLARYHHDYRNNAAYTKD